MLLFALTIFTSAFLLFQVQPLIARFILPWFGGAPTVWTTCMLFFQIVLLLGYLYADLVNRWLRPRGQVILHSLLAVAALLLLPITPNESWKPTGDESPTLRILLLLMASIGLPYFLLSTTGPLVQAWFARCYPERSPYRLYALSNVGSLLALISYPLIFEPLMATRTQSSTWGYGFALFAILVIATGWFSIRRGSAAASTAISELPETSEKREATDTTAAPKLSQLFSWILLAAIPSVLLLATTNQLCQEVAVVPFLWIIPLSLYLLSFIICFDQPAWYSRTFFGTLLVGSTISSIYCLTRFGGGELFMTLASLLILLFSACMTCHGELVRQRPVPRFLTLYYLMISVGGALGGSFVAFLAPSLFKGFFELHWSIFAAVAASLSAMLFNGGQRELTRIALLSSAGLLAGSFAAMLDTGNVKQFGNSLIWRSSCAAAFWLITLILIGWNDEWRCYKKTHLEPASQFGHPRLNTPWVIALLSILSLITVVFLFFPKIASDFWREGTLVYFVILAAFAAGFKVEFGISRAWPSWSGKLFTLVVSAAIGLLLLQHAYRQDRSTIEIQRDFYGLLKVKEASSVTKVNGRRVDEGSVRSLVNGRTLHGYQFTRPDLQMRITTYYSEGSGIGLAIARHPKRLLGRPISIGVVGLGVGTLAAWTEPGDKITFYEINPQCVEIAKSKFSYLTESPADKKIILGDARIQMERQVREQFEEADESGRITRNPETGLYDVLAIDAFSSDAIPRHLLTAESFRIYRQLLKSDGILAVHVSNLHLDLRPITISLAEEENWPARIVEDSPDESTAPGRWQSSSTWIVITGNQEFWDDPEVSDRAYAWESPWRIHWTDDFGSLVQVLRAPQWMKQPKWWPWKEFWLKRED